MMELLDARGYQIQLNGDPGTWYRVRFLGAAANSAEADPSGEDPYTVPAVRDLRFSGTYEVWLRDPAITMTGLCLAVEAEDSGRTGSGAGTGGSTAVLTVRLCGELERTITLTPGVTEELHVTPGELHGLLSREKAYLADSHRILGLIIREVDRICRRHGIRYSLVFGGLLGALRFGEIIPWDDDLDIAMRREDYRRFRQACRKELGAGFRLVEDREIGKDAFLDFLNRVVYTGEKLPLTIYDKVRGRCSRELMGCVPLDIYILDGASDSPLLHRLHMLLVRGVYGLAMGHRTRLDLGEYEGKGKGTLLAVKVLSGIGRFVPPFLLFRLHDHVSALFSGHKTKDYFLSNGFLPFIHTRYAREWFDRPGSTLLSGMELMAPSDIRAFLKRAYYDYYHYPPAEKRIPGHGPSPEARS